MKECKYVGRMMDDGRTRVLLGMCGYFCAHMGTFGRAGTFGYFWARASTFGHAGTFGRARVLWGRQGYF